MRHYPSPATYSQFNAFYSYNSLLIQFIISEFLALYDSFFTFTQNEKESSYSTEISFLIESFGVLLNEWIAEENATLTGSAYKRGRLLKIKDYCAQLAQNNSPEKKAVTQLHHAIQKMWIAVLQFLQRISSTPFSSRKGAVFSTFRFQRMRATLTKSLSTIASLLYRVLKNYHYDENVTLFLLRKREEWAKEYRCILSQEFLQRLIAPQPDAKLLEKYRARGFNHLLPLIENTASSLRSCHASFS